MRSSLQEKRIPETRREELSFNFNFDYMTLSNSFTKLPQVGLVCWHLIPEDHILQVISHQGKQHPVEVQSQLHFHIKNN